MGDGAAGEMEELARYKCLGDDGSNVVVVEYRDVPNSHADNGSPRRYPGARHLILTTGVPVRFVDAYTFEVIERGDILRDIKLGHFSAKAIVLPCLTNYQPPPPSQKPQPTATKTN